MASFADARERLTGPPRQLRWLAAVAASLALHAVAWTLLTRLASTPSPVERPMIVGVVPVTPEAPPAGIAEGAAARRVDEETRRAEAKLRADEARRAEDARVAAEARRLGEARQAEAVRQAAEATATGPYAPAAPEGGAFSPGPAAPRLDPGRAASGAASSGYGGGLGYEPPRLGYEPPRLVARSAVDPQYPPSAYRLGVEGIALVGVAVKPDGTVAKTAIVRSAGHPELDRAALEAVRRWLFEPARRDGAPVAGAVQVPVRFELR